MSSQSGNFPFMQFSLSMWLFGASISSFVAAMIMNTFTYYVNLIGVIVFTIVGACCLLLGYGVVLKKVPQMADKDGLKAFKIFSIFTMLIDVVLIVICYGVPNTFGEYIVFT